MLGFRKRIQKKIDKSLLESLYEEYLKTCRYTGDLPLKIEEYEKRFYRRFEESDE